MFTRPQGIAFKNLPQEACGTGWQPSLLVASRLAGPAGRRIAGTRLPIDFKPSRSVKSVALGVSLVLSALLTAAALRLPDLHWLAWISFLPLFVVVRSLGCPVPSRGGGRNRRVPHSSRSEGWGTDGSAKRLRLVNPSPTLSSGKNGAPAAAALAGGFWGGCLYLFCTTGPTPAVDTVGAAVGPSAWLLALLIVIPAVYVGLAARPARAIGFKLLTLALGWTLVEAVLHLHNHLGPHEGLLTASQGEGLHLHWLARLLGYVSTAFLVACVNASLVGILSGARLSFPACRSLAGSRDIVARLLSQVAMPIQYWALRQAHPRAPPIPIALPSCSLVGSAH